MHRFEDWGRPHWMLAFVLLIAGGWGVTQAVKAFSRPTPEMIVQGQELFEHEWQTNDPLANGGDGLGPVFNAKSCVACHFQGGVGGGGTNQFNVTSFMALPNPQAAQTELVAGVIHADAILDTFQETVADVRDRFPIIKGLRRDDGHCVYQEPDFDPLIVKSVSTPAIFGSGEIDKISGSAIKSSRRWNLLSQIGQELQGQFDNIPAGRVRILPDGRVGKFGWKAQFATLEEFVATACAVEVGLTNPLRAQEIPKQHVPDEDAKLDLDKKQFRALVAFCAELPPPIDAHENDSAEVAQGRALFSSVGCAVCHVPEFDGVAGVYSDFLLYSLENKESASYEPIPSKIPLPSTEPRPDEWKTPPLWGVADSAPYLHDGSAPTLAAAIYAHQGDARSVLKSFEKLRADEKQSLLAFLQSLKAPHVPSVLAPEVKVAQK